MPIFFVSFRQHLKKNFRITSGCADETAMYSMQQSELIPGPIRKNLGCRPWDQLVESDYKNVATVINPLVYWLSFTDGLISLTDPGSEVVSCGILTTITQVEIHGREWKCIVILNKLSAYAAQPLVEGQNFNKLQAPSSKRHEKDTIE